MTSNHRHVVAYKREAARELAERQDALHIELAAQRERAARAEAERDALRRELAEARKPWWRRWFP